VRQFEARAIEHEGLSPTARSSDLGCSIRFAVPRTLLTGAFACQGCLGALLLAGLQIVRVPLDVFDDVFLHDLSLEALERALQALALVKTNFCQLNSPRFRIVFDSSA